MKLLWKFSFKELANRNYNNKNFNINNNKVYKDNIIIDDKKLPYKKEKKKTK